MHLTAEVIGKYDHAADANKLLYAPLSTQHAFRESRRYQVDYDGDHAALAAFLTRVLANETSHEITLAPTSALAGWDVVIDYGMKAGALDLEKEAIVNYYRGLAEAGFILNSLKIERRIYLYGVPQPEAADIAQKFVRDIVNPAIHNHRVELAA